MGLGDDRLKIERIDSDSRSARMVLSQGDLLILNNALNEVCNGVDIEDFEFSTRLGAERSDARQLLAQLQAGIDALTDELA
jgi:hypothetical protein